MCFLISFLIDVFSNVFSAAKEDLSFSVVGKRHNLDLMVNSMEKRDEWVEGLLQILQASTMRGDE